MASAGRRGSAMLCRLACSAESVTAGPAAHRGFSRSPCLRELRHLARVKVVDNSKIGLQTVLTGKPARVIHVYNKTGVAKIGDQVLLAIMGQKKQAFVVGCKQKQQPNVPRFDSNNVVLVEEGGAPTGTRVRVPIPSVLRQKTDGEFTKILSIAAKYV